MKIGILGGSFDPIHQGHLALARESEKQFRLDKILFVPVLISPTKSGQASVTPAPLRARMVELAIQEEPRWELSDIELSRAGVSYTVDTLRQLRKIYPLPHKLFFIAGADSYLDLAKWKKPEEIMRLSEWIVAPRPSSRLPSKLPPRFHLLRMPPVEISASELRDKIEQGKNVSAWVPSQVKNYLKRMKIYREKVS
jgi:nicotinate-nucleotide adenylyltransferase